jgi:mono/diheme cytochrome c family protein
MKKSFIISLTLLTLIITACGGQPTQTSPELVAPIQSVPASAPAGVSTNVTAPAAEVPVASVSFAKDVMPIFENNCNKCHGGEQMKAGLDIRTYDSLMAGSFNGPVIVTGNSADSLLVQMVTEGKMPKRGSKLTPEQIKTISDWINAGAANN